MKMMKNWQIFQILNFQLIVIKKKYLITANEGNFLNGDEILLKKNVVFKSNKFKIYQ